MMAADFEKLRTRAADASCKVGRPVIVRRGRYVVVAFNPERGRVMTKSRGQERATTTGRELGSAAEAREVCRVFGEIRAKSPKAHPIDCLDLAIEQHRAARAKR